MNVKKNLLSLLLALCIVLALMPSPIASATNESDDEDESTYTATVMPGSITATATGVTTARMTLQQLQEKFPDSDSNGKCYWNGGDVDSYTNSPCPTHYGTTAYCNHFISDGNNASQCYGFALKLGWDAYGISPRNWSYTKENSYVDSLKPGDIISSDAPNDHTVFVIGVTDTQIIVGECNWGENCIISWGRHIDKSKIKNWTIFKIYIAPSELPISSTNTTPPVTPEITLSQSSVSIETGKDATVTIRTKSPGSCYLKASISNQNVCSCASGNWNSTGTEIPLTITGKDVGTATITVYMYDSESNAELTSKAIDVKVIPPSIQPPSPQISMDTIDTLNRTGNASLYPTVFKGYLRGTDKYEAYSDSTGTTSIGRIYPTDELKVQSVYSNNGTLWISALCPWDGYSSDRLIYAKLDAMIDTSYAPRTAIAASSAPVYTRADAAAKYGSLGKGDAVTVVGQSGQYAQIIYPLAAGGYKIGWCQITSLVRPGISDVKATSSTSIHLKYAIPSNAANNLVIMDENQKILLRGGISDNDVNVSKMTPGATYYIYIESTLFNGTGSVLSAAKKITLK